MSIKAQEAVCWTAFCDTCGVEVGYEDEFGTTHYHSEVEAAADLREVGLMDLSGRIECWSCREEREEAS